MTAQLTGSWGYYMQGVDQEELGEAGAELSRRIHCAVHYPAFGKRLFECKCGVVFPVFLVEGAILTGDWSSVISHHTDGFRPGK